MVMVCWRKVQWSFHKLHEDFLIQNGSGFLLTWFGNSVEDLIPMIPLIPSKVMNGIEYVT